jgi:hypothetical protein
MKPITPELINSLTPVLIAIIGGIIGVTVIVKAPAKDWASGMGLAGTAIAGASGLAQSGKGESTDSDSKIQNEKV